MPEKVIINWEATNLRFTLFSNSPIDPNFDYSKLWPNLENVTVKSQTKSPVTGEYRQEASYKNYKLILVALPNKFDVVLSSENPILMAEPYGLAMLGSFKEVIKIFDKIVKKWVANEHIKTVQRVGFGVDLFHRAKSYEEGFEKIGQFLPYTFNPKTSSDFRLQINKFTQSQVDKAIKINRLTNWGVLNFKMQMTNSANPTITMQLPDIFYCNASFDINTAQEYAGEIDKVKIPPLYTELIEQATKLSEEGINKL